MNFYNKKNPEKSLYQYLKNIDFVIHIKQFIFASYLLTKLK